MSEVQRPLAGQFRMIVNVSGSGYIDAHLLHRPHPESPFGTVILGSKVLKAEDDEIIEGSWDTLLERVFAALLA